MDIFQNHRPSAAATRRFAATPERPLALLQACPAYEPTPLHTADKLAAQCEIGSLWLKDESQRMRLGSFKALGGSFAVAQIIRDAAQEALGAVIPPEDLTNKTVQTLASSLTFITASAGNHGLSVAAGARIFGANAVIVLSETVPDSFAARLEALGATVQRVHGVYEDSVAHAIAEAEKKGWQLLADGSWPGYIDPPAMVMEGYTVLAEECRKAFADTGTWPTHVFVQAGVGGMAAAIAGHIRDHWAEQPSIVVVEPDAAPCLITSARAGELTHASGPVSNMGRLDCKDASLIAFEALQQGADFFLTISDTEAKAAVDHLSAIGIASSPSGVAGIAAVMSASDETRDAIGLSSDSRCLAIISEGTT